MRLCIFMNMLAYSSKLKLYLLENSLWHLLLGESVVFSSGSDGTEFFVCMFPHHFWKVTFMRSPKSLLSEALPHHLPGPWSSFACFWTFVYLGVPQSCHSLFFLESYRLCCIPVNQMNRTVMRGMRGRHWLVWPSRTIISSPKNSASLSLTYSLSVT